MTEQWYNGHNAALLTEQRDTAGIVANIDAQHRARHIIATLKAIQDKDKAALQRIEDAYVTSDTVQTGKNEATRGALLRDLLQADSDHVKTSSRIAERTQHIAQAVADLERLAAMLPIEYLSAGIPVQATVRV